MQKWKTKYMERTFFFWKNVSHQCCLLDRFHCCWSDSRNAVRARTLCAHLIGILRWPPGPQNACGCRGCGTVMKPGPEAPSPARPAGTAPRDALEGACHWRKCHWSCCNIWSETNRDGRETFINARALLSVHSLTALSSALHAHSFSLKVCHQTQKNSELILLVHKTMTALTQLERSHRASKTVFIRDYRPHSL